jgi:hypothetical protein
VFGGSLKDWDGAIWSNIREQLFFFFVRNGYFVASRFGTGGMDPQVGGQQIQSVCFVMVRPWS